VKELIFLFSDLITVNQQRTLQLYKFPIIHLLLFQFFSEWKKSVLLVFIIDIEPETL